MTLPNAIDSEKGLLCSFLLSPLEVGSMCASAGLTGAGFHHPAHAQIFDVLMELWGEQKPADFITVTQVLRNRGVLESAGGAAYVTELACFVGTAANAKAYLEEVEAKRVLRGVIKTCREYAQRAQDDQGDVFGLVEGLCSQITSLACSARKSEPRTMKQLLLAKLHRMVDESPAENIIRTGLEKLDRESPVSAGDMPLIVGETKAGKTMLALTVASHIATEEKRPVLYFSLEDASDKPLDRILAGLARVPISKHHKKWLTEGELMKIHQAVQRVGESKLEIRDDVHDLSGFVATCRQFKAKHGDLGAVVLDYAQLLKATVRKQDTREQEIALISRTCRLLGLELNCAMIVLSQLNKDGDTRESKALENDMTAQWKVAMTDDPNKRLLSIPRQRNGSSGIGFPLTFLGHIARFENYSGPDEESEGHAPAKPPTRKNFR